MQNQTLVPLVFAILALTSGCASTQTPKPAVCDGKHRRPANPYGTVLPTVPLPTASAAALSPPTSSPNPSTTPEQPPAKPAPSVAPGPMSLLDMKSLDPCGRPA